MILIADSGSTKTEWILLNQGEEILRTETIGLNPFFVSPNEIQTVINQSALSPYLDQVKKLNFYGAGCSNDTKKEDLNQSFNAIFNNAEIHIKTDIEGAVMAVSEDHPCIVCILGTGSTFRIFDGKNIIRKYSSLSYILGDEGSGTYIAKRLLRGVFYQQLPQHVINDFFKDYPINAEELLHNTYREPQANRYLASFVPFCKKHIQTPEIESIVLQSFEDFYKVHLSRLELIKDYPVHFIGSIAFYFSDQLMQIALKYNFKVGNIVQKPLGMLKKKLS